MYFIYDKNKTYKLGDAFSKIVVNFGGINDKAETILKKMIIKI